jgi:hypothetical protein
MHLNNENYILHLRARLSEAKANIKFLGNWQREVDECIEKLGKCSEDPVIAESRKTNLTNERRAVELITELLAIHKK